MLIKKFESYTQLPKKVFPTDKCVHYNSLSELFKKHGLDEREYKNNSKKDFWSGFIHGKMYKNVIFPEMKQSDVVPNSSNMVYGQEIFLLPKHYDDSNDKKIYDKKKKDFLNNMKKLLGSDYNEKELIKHVNFGNVKFNWVNDFLRVVYEEFKEYYQKDHLRVWLPKDTDDKPWIGYDFPHKYSLHGEKVSPNGVYYLSDIEEYIHDKYGISDDLLYDFLVKNQYIEGRYWERVWGFFFKDHTPSSGKLSRGDSKYGMKATENINHILNILEKDFSHDFVGGSYISGLPVFVDYYKKIKDY